MRTRILFVLALLALVTFAYSPQQPAIAQVGPGDVLKLGVITYHFDGAVWADIEAYQPLLGMDLAKYPGVPLEYGAVVLPTFVGRSENFPHSGGGTMTASVEPKTELVFKVADTADGQVAAINELVAQGVHGILITPVSDVEPVRKALCAALDRGVLVAVGQRPIAQLPSRYFGRAGFVGLEPYAVGTVWGQLANPEYQARYEKGRGKPVSVVVFGSSFDDPMQADLLEGIMTRAETNFLASVVTSADGAYDAAQQVINDNKGAVFAQENAVMAFIASDPHLAFGIGQAANEAVEAAKAEGQKINIKVASYTAPPEWREMNEASTINRIAHVDSYQLYLLGLVQLKMGAVYGEPLHNAFLYVRGGVDSGSYTRYPYFEPVWYPGVPETTNSGDMSSSLSFF